MNPFELMTYYENDFTKSDHIIKKAITENPNIILRCNIISASEHMDVSKSALLRFCKKLGYSGFSDFKYDLNRFMFTGGLDQDAHSTETTSVLALMQKAIGEMENTISKTDLEDLSKMIGNAKNVRLFGLQSSGTAATQLMYRMAKIGILSQTILDFYLYEDINGFANEDDLHIFFSLSATSFDGLMDCSTKAKTVLITQNTRSELCKNFDKVILLPSLESNHKDAFIECHFLTFAFIELLIIQLSKDFAKKEQ